MSNQADDDSSGPWSKEARQKFENKSKSEYYDPCQEAAARSIRCMNRNGGERAMCTDYFEAYRECKKEWTKKRKEDRKKSGGSWFSLG